MTRTASRFAAWPAWLALCAASAALAGESPEQEIERLDAELLAAMASHDTPTVDRMLLDEFVLITSGGRVHTKREILAEVGSPAVVFEANASREIRVRVRGDTAVLTGVLHQKGVQDGQPFDATVRYTDTWVRDGGAWRQLSGHASRYAPDG